MPESAQYAETSSASGPGPNPFVRLLGAGVWTMRTTSQSFPDGDHAPGGTVTEPRPPLEVAVVEPDELVFFWTAPVVPIVKWIWNGELLPLASRSWPASVCDPVARAPVL